MIDTRPLTFVWRPRKFSCGSVEIGSLWEARGGIHQRLDRNIRIGSINGEPEFSAFDNVPITDRRKQRRCVHLADRDRDRFGSGRHSVSHGKRNLMDSRPLPLGWCPGELTSSRIEGRTNRQPGRTVDERLRGHIRIRSRDGKPELRAFVHRPVADWSQHRRTIPNTDSCNSLSLTPLIPGGVGGSHGERIGPDCERHIGEGELATRIGRGGKAEPQQFDRGVGFRLPDQYDTGVGRLLVAEREGRDDRVQGEWHHGLRDIAPGVRRPQREGVGAIGKRSAVDLFQASGAQCKRPVRLTIGQNVEGRRRAEPCRERGDPLRIVHAAGDCRIIRESVAVGSAGILLQGGIQGWSTEVAEKMNISSRRFQRQAVEILGWEPSGVESRIGAQ